MGDITEQRITVNPRVMFGKPVIAGTRIPVEVILDHLGAGEPIEQVLTEYPRLTPEDIFAAIRYAANLMRQAAMPHSQSPESPEAVP